MPAAPFQKVATSLIEQRENAILGKSAVGSPHFFLQTSQLNFIELLPDGVAVFCVAWKCFAWLVTDVYPPPLSTTHTHTMFPWSLYSSLTHTSHTHTISLISLAHRHIVTQTHTNTQKERKRERAILICLYTCTNCSPGISPLFHTYTVSLISLSLSLLHTHSHTHWLPESLSLSLF